MQNSSLWARQKKNGTSPFSWPLKEGKKRKLDYIDVCFFLPRSRVCLLMRRIFFPPFCVPGVGITGNNGTRVFVGGLIYNRVCFPGMGVVPNPIVIRRKYVCSGVNNLFELSQSIFLLFFFLLD